MFFYLGHQPHARFPRHYALGSLTLSTDQGWHQHQSAKKTRIYKGYANEFDLASGVTHITQDHQHTGNYCVFCHDHDTGVISVFTNQWRGFPMWYDKGNALSNLHRADYSIWCDSEIALDQQLGLQEIKVDVMGTIDTNEIDLDLALDIIHQRLDHTVRAFLAHNTRPLRVFCSGGVDSMLVYSYLRRHTTQIDLVLEERVQWDDFWCWNSRLLQTQFWTYGQIHHWTDPCVLASGAPGDEFMLRSPVTADLWLRRHGSSIPQSMTEYPQCLHHDYFDLEKHQRVFRENHQNSEIHDLCDHDFHRYLCNIVLNDHQHWHLGHTLTFTPLRDLEIFKILLRLDVDSAQHQIMDSSISRRLIQRNDPRLLDYLSPVKNTGESLCNMPGLMSNISAVSGQ